MEYSEEDELAEYLARMEYEEHLRLESEAYYQEEENNGL